VMPVAALLGFGGTYRSRSCPVVYRRPCAIGEITTLHAGGA
jgi:hypothetical protein